MKEPICYLFHSFRDTDVHGLDMVRSMQSKQLQKIPVSIYIIHAVDVTHVLNLVSLW